MLSVEKVEGLVVGETPYSESSKILSVLTRKYGLISILSKGCRKPKSKLREASSKLSLALFNINYRENAISNCTSADNIYYFKNILMDYKDISKISYALYIIEQTVQILREKDMIYEDIKDIYDMLIAALKKIEEGFNPKILSNIIELKYLDFLGVRPSIDACSICGSNQNIVTISTSDFGYVCRGCHTNQKLVSNDTVKMLRMLYYVDITRISKLDIDSAVVKEINQFLEEYYEEHTGLYLKAKNNLKNLNKIGINV